MRETLYSDFFPPFLFSWVLVHFWSRVYLSVYSLIRSSVRCCLNVVVGSQRCLTDWLIKRLISVCEFDSWVTLTIMTLSLRLCGLFYLRLFCVGFHLLTLFVCLLYLPLFMLLSVWLKHSQAVYIKAYLCIVLPATAVYRTTWLMVNCSRRKICLHINTDPGPLCLQ